MFLPPLGLPIPLLWPFFEIKLNGSFLLRVLLRLRFTTLGPGKRGRYERGLFTGGRHRISRISKFSTISRKWSDSHLFSTVWGFSRISRISKFSRISRKWTFLKRPLFLNPKFLSLHLSQRGLIQLFGMQSSAFWGHMHHVHLNSAQQMVPGDTGMGASPDTVCWTRLTPQRAPKQCPVNGS